MPPPPPPFAREISRWRGGRDSAGGSNAWVLVDASDRNKAPDKAANSVPLPPPPPPSTRGRGGLVAPNVAAAAARAVKSRPVDAERTKAPRNFVGDVGAGSAEVEAECPRAGPAAEEGRNFSRALFGGYLHRRRKGVAQKIKKRKKKERERERYLHNKLCR